jgi:hypothetical protein
MVIQKEDGPCQFEEAEPGEQLKNKKLDAPKHWNKKSHPVRMAFCHVLYT